MREAGPLGGPGLRCTASSLETKPQKGLGREHQGRDHEAPGDTNKLSGAELATKRWEDFSFNGFGFIVSVRILTAPFSQEGRGPRRILTRNFPERSQARRGEYTSRSTWPRSGVRSVLPLAANNPEDVMDVSVDIFLPRLCPMAGLRQERREFVWEGVVYPQEPETYRWGRQVELQKYAQPPAHILSLLPQGLFQTDWSYFVLEGNGLDLLSREINGQEVNWDEHPLEAFFLEQLSKNNSWAVVFMPHCDQLDFSQETTAEGFMTLLKAQLDWTQKRKGFLAWKRSSSGT